MPGLFFKIPLTLWVRGTIEKMNRFGKRDIQSWSQYWLETYKELGGQSEESGTKGCPQHAAYGLWRLGRITDSNLPYQPKAITSINREFGKNVSYAIIAIELLETRQAARDNTSIWIQVQEIYRRSVHEEPAKSQQGAITVAVTLFKEGQILAVQE